MQFCYGDKNHIRILEEAEFWKRQEAEHTVVIRKLYRTWKRSSQKSWMNTKDSQRDRSHNSAIYWDTEQIRLCDNFWIGTKNCKYYWNNTTSKSNLRKLPKLHGKRECRSGKQFDSLCCN